MLFQWWCLSCLHVLSGGFGRGADEGTGVPLLSQDPGEMVFFLLQVVLPSGDGFGSVEQALDYSPLDLGWMMGVSMLFYVIYSWQTHRFHFSTGNSSVDNL